MASTSSCFLALLFLAPTLIMGDVVGVPNIGGNIPIPNIGLNDIPKIDMNDLPKIGMNDIPNVGATGSSSSISSNFLAGISMRQCTQAEEAALPSGNNGFGMPAAGLSCRPSLNYFLRQTGNAVRSAMNSLGGNKKW